MSQATPVAEASGNDEQFASEVPVQPKQLGSPVELPQQQEDAVLKLKGLPYSATEAQILEFFRGFDVKTVAFVSEPDGRPSGLAFAEFSSKEEALKALSKNGDYMGDRYVRLLHVPKSEMEEQVRLGTLAIPGTAAKLRSRLLRAQQARGAAGPMQPYLAGPQLLAQHAMLAGGAGLPRGTPMVPIAAAGTIPVAGLPGYRAASGMASAQALMQPDARLWHGYAQAAVPLHQQFAGMSLGGQPAAAMLQSPQQHMGMLAAVQHQQQQQQLNQSGSSAMLRPLPLHHQTMGLPPHMQAMAAAGYGQQPHMQMAGHGSMGVTMGSGGRASSGSNTDSMLGSSSGGSLPRTQHSYGPVGCTVKIRGLPYRSAPDDILSFFQGYHFVADSLQLGLDAKGRPSGEAWLTFGSPPEAERAVQQLNKQYLGSRYLELSVC